MPRVSRLQQAANRDAIEDVSARLFRERGLNGVSVADLMAAAGLTHGGFYGHFDSKDALAAAACTRAFAQSSQRRAAWLAHVNDTDDRRSGFVARYLSVRHRDDPGHGCPAAALACDVGREPRDKPVRSAYAAGLANMVKAVAALSAAGATGAARQRAQALTDVATLVGALVLSRATKGDPISAEILAAVQATLAPASLQP